MEDGAAGGVEGCGGGLHGSLALMGMMASGISA